MSRIQRIIAEVVVALLLISLIGAVMSVAKAEPVRTLSNDTALVVTAPTNTPMQAPIWLLGIAMIGGAVIFRDKAP